MLGAHSRERVSFSILFITNVLTCTTRLQYSRTLRRAAAIVVNML